MVTSYNRVMSLLAVLLVISTTATGQEIRTTPQVEMAQYFIGMIYKGDKWAAIPPAEAAEIQKGHRANIDRLEQAGQLLLAGPIDNANDLRGIFIYRTATLAEAEELVKTDPAVIAGRLRIEVYPFWATKSLEKLAGD